jgi:lipoyl(octanoyl) transferase
MEADARAFAAAEAAGATGHAPLPGLTWWTWERPTISLGLGQDRAHAVDEAAVAAAGIPVVTRPTGGRAILHADEWTYSAVVPLDHPALGGPRDASTRALVALIGRALTDAYGLAFDPPSRSRDAATGEPAGDAAGACFARAFGYELTVGGRKLMGSAQRRGRHALLQQGSLLVGPGHERLARFLPLPAEQRARLEARLSTAAIPLGAILGRQPDPAPFRSALARRMEEVLAPFAGPGERSS